MSGAFTTDLRPLGVAHTGAAPGLGDLGAAPRSQGGPSGLFGATTSPRRGTGLEEAMPAATHGAERPARGPACAQSERREALPLARR